MIMRNFNGQQVSSVLCKFIWLKADIILFALLLAVKVFVFNMSTELAMGKKALLLSGGSLLIFMAILNLFDNVYRRIGLILINTGLSFLLFSDMVYWRYFNDFISVPVLTGFGQVGDIKASIFELLRLSDIIYAADIVIGIILLPLYKKVKNTNLHRQNNKLSLILFGVGTTVMVGVILMSSFRIFSMFPIPSAEARMSNQELIESVGVFNYHALDFFQYFKGKFIKPEVSPEEIDEINSWFSARSMNQNRGPFFGRAKGKNLLVIQEESFQQFVIGLKIEGQEITPNLNKLVGESMYFKNFYDQTHTGRTSDAEFTALASLYPLASGSVNYLYPSHDYDSLPKRLASNGYYTFSAHAYRKEFWNRSIMHRKFGFARSFFEEDYKQGDQLSWGLSDLSFFEQTLDKMAGLPRPFFGFLISLSNHHPYVVPPQYKELKLGELEGTLIGDYLHSVHYVDKTLGILIDGLKRKGLYDQSVLVIYGDHDAGIPNDELGKVINVGKDEFDSKNLDRVPFLIRLPDGSVKNSSSQVCGHLDITPTLLHLFGISSKDTYFIGSNIFDERTDRMTVFRNGSFIDERSAFMTKTGLFDDGSAYTFPSKGPIDKSDIKPLFTEAQRQLGISDLVIKANLIPKLKELAD